MLLPDHASTGKATVTITVSYEALRNLREDNIAQELLGEPINDVVINAIPPIPRNHIPPIPRNRMPIVRNLFPINFEDDSESD